MQKPVDKYGNTPYSFESSIYVIKAIEQKDKKNEVYLKVLEPKGYRRGVDVPKNFYVETEGPSKKLSKKAYLDLVHDLIPTENSLKKNIEIWSVIFIPKK